MPDVLLNPFTGRLDFAGLSTTEANALYIRRDGTTSLTANWNAGSFDIYAQRFMDSASGNDTGMQLTLSNRLILRANNNIFLDASGTTVELGEVAGWTVNVGNDGSGAVGLLSPTSTAYQFTSTVGTGVSPFSIASTTVNTNFNADLHDGLHVATSGSAVPNMSSANTWSAEQTFDGGLRLNSSDTITFGPSGGTANMLVYHDSVSQDLIFKRSSVVIGKPDIQFDGGLNIDVSGTEMCQFGPTPTVVTPSDTNDMIVATKSTSTTSGTRRAGLFTSEFTGTAASSIAINGVNGFAGTSSASTGNLTATTLGGGLRSRYVVQHQGIGIVSQGSAVSARVVLATTGGSMTDGFAFHAEGANLSAVSTTLTRGGGLWIRDGSSLGTYTTQYGIRIDSLTAGTNNIAIAIGGTGAGKGIYFNTTTAASTESIYASASNTLDINANTSINMNISNTLSDGFRIGSSAITFKNTVITTNPVLSWADDRLAMTTGSFGVLQDSKKMIFGAGLDVHIQYTGTVWQFDIAQATTEIAFNDASFDTDFRVEGNGDANLLFLDAGNDRVGIGMNNPGQKLDITGDLKFGAAGGAQGSRLIGRGEHTSAPAGSLGTGEWELSVYDDGASPVLRVRYNDGGVEKTGNVSLA